MSRTLNFTSPTRARSALASLLAAAAAVLACGPVRAWEPTKAVEFIVPAGTGGGADQMARFIQGVVAKNGLMKQPIVVVNKGGGAGAEGFLDVKNDKANPHKIVITLSNLFTTPLGTAVPFNWRDMTPVSMMALDQFVLWVNAESPHQTAKAFFDALKAGPDRAMKMGGTGSKQEDQIITVMLEKAAGKKMTYIPYGGGGQVATQLVGKHVDATVNNPIEAESHWRAGKLRALCVFDAQPLPYKDKVTDKQSWANLPTCRSAGIPVEYVMLRGIFMPPGITPEQQKFYVDLMARVRALPEWKDFMTKGAFNQTTMSGQAYFDWLGRTEQQHRVLMREAGFLAN
ncbi:MAG: Bug family tripartite tricarboxylate transporter substrate binding protein [Pseudomonadota bacterium]|jgi:putative tricarboxylic transport membrane protein|nr:tripartite tricarboxylate transporter substrate binding protein [Rubrivivax sp.]MCA3256937.1 tripartite tricarboxylate transporter substrate binding protein [Rubrivivax sp.]MCZ8032797.1 tripartite tricarboxylate transporter substrate-binding protein [Rubrivivax sp.]